MNIIVNEGRLKGTIGKVIQDCGAYFDVRTSDINRILVPKSQVSEIQIKKEIKMNLDFGLSDHDGQDMQEIFAPLHVTQKEFAKRLGTSEGYFWRCLHSKTFLTKKFWDRFMKVVEEVQNEKNKQSDAQ